MTDHQFHEAKKLLDIDKDLSIRQAAEQVGVPYPTLRRWLRKDEKPQAATESEPESEPQYGTKKWHNKMLALDRKRMGLPPLTEVEKQQIDEAERITAEHFKGVELPWRPKP